MLVSTIDTAANVSLRKKLAVFGLVVLIALGFEAAKFLHSNTPANRWGEHHRYGVSDLARQMSFDDSKCTGFSCSPQITRYAQNLKNVLPTSDPKATARIQKALDDMIQGDSISNNSTCVGYPCPSLDAQQAEMDRGIALTRQGCAEWNAIFTKGDLKLTGESC